MAVRIMAEDGHEVGGDDKLDDEMREYIDANGGWAEDLDGNVLYGKRAW